MSGAVLTFVVPPPSGAEIVVSYGAITGGASSLSGLATTANLTSEMARAQAAESVNAAAAATAQSTATAAQATATGALNANPVSWYNVLTYGGDPTGSADNCGAGGPVRKALAAMPASGGVLYFPAGHGPDYLCNETISAAAMPVVVRGDGKGQSILVFAADVGTTGGLNIAEDNAGKYAKVDGLTFRTMVNQSGPAISATWPDHAVNTGPTITGEDFEIDGGSDNSHYWKRGITCRNCAHWSFTNYNIRGRDEGNPATGISAANMDAGIALTGQSTDGSSDGRCIVTFANYGWYGSGDSEGNHFSGCTGLAVNRAWYLDDGASGDSFAQVNSPGWQITNSHCDAYMGCVVSKGWMEVIVTNNLFYKRSESTQPWYGVAFLDGTYGGTTVGTLYGDAHGNSMVGNSFAGSTSAATAAIALGPSAQSNVLHDNYVGSVTYGINEGSAAGKNFFYNNTSNQIPGLGIVSGWVVNPGSNMLKPDQP